MRLLRYFGWPAISGLITAAAILVLFPELINSNTKFSPPIIAPPQVKPANHSNTEPAANLDKEANLAGLATTLVTSYADAVRIAAPSVVNIYTHKRAQHPLANDPVFRRFFDQSDPPQQQRMESSLGSGVIVDSRGFILTNSHVVTEADEIVALLYDGREAVATVVGNDIDSDLAVLKIDLDKLNAIPVALHSKPEVGDIVLAIGNPFGIGQSVSQGIISATGRKGLNLNKYENFLQTDAAINPGNSGGALIDVNGNLVGINSATLNETSFVGIGFAIPSDMAIKVLEDIVTHGRVIRGWLGVAVQPLKPQIAAELGLNPPAALIITAVPAYGPAYKSGLQPGDLITHINDIIVSDGAREVDLIANLAPGDPIKLRIIRENARLTINAVAGIRPPS